MEVIAYFIGGLIIFYFLFKRRPIKQDEAKIFFKSISPDLNKINFKGYGKHGKELKKHAQNMDWGLYRNTRFEMGEVFRKENKLKETIETYLEVLYFDLNAPNNLGGVIDAFKDEIDRLRAYPPFGPEFHDDLPPTITSRIIKYPKKINLNLSNFEEKFKVDSSILWKAYKMPLSPDQCWEKIKKAHEDV